MTNENTDRLHDNVGANIISIITESLYDKPIVVFREYVQNSVDSFLKSEDGDFKSCVWTKQVDGKTSLYFLDNGNGIEKDIFENTMRKIAYSGKNKITNLGYKGIGRLSGISYCDELDFINICDYANNDFQVYSINRLELENIKNSDEYSEMSFEDLMDRIGSIKTVDYYEKKEIKDTLLSKNFEGDSGFLVILKNIGFVLKQTIDDKNFNDELGWLLPVKFKDELLYEAKEKELFIELSSVSSQETHNVIPAKSYKVIFNDNIIERPITSNMLRTYTCMTNLKYGTGFYSFFRDKIAVSKDNKFSGIKIYIDNILLCDENELIPMLKKYGLLEHSVNELIQTVNGIGANIYITDKVNISANARRTFIEITDMDSMEFMKLLAVFVKKIYNTRYALSKYGSELKKAEQNTAKVEGLREVANAALQELANEKVELFTEDDVIDYESLDVIEKKQRIKRIITTKVNGKIKDYLSQLSDPCSPEDAYKSFFEWFLANSDTD